MESDTKSFLYQDEKIGLLEQNSEWKELSDYLWECYEADKSDRSILLRLILENWYILKMAGEEGGIKLSEDCLEKIRVRLVHSVDTGNDVYFDDAEFLYMTAQAIMNKPEVFEFNEHIEEWLSLAIRMKTRALDLNPDVELNIRNEINQGETEAETFFKDDFVWGAPKRVVQKRRRIKNTIKIVVGVFLAFCFVMIIMKGLHACPWDEEFQTESRVNKNPYMEQNRTISVFKTKARKGIAYKVTVDYDKKSKKSKKKTFIRERDDDKWMYQGQNMILFNDTSIDVCNLRNGKKIRVVTAPIGYEIQSIEAKGDSIYYVQGLIKEGIFSNDRGSEAGVYSVTGKQDQTDKLSDEWYDELRIENGKLYGKNVGWFITTVDEIPFS